LVSLRKRHSTNVDKDEPPVRTSPVTLDAPSLPSEAKAPVTNGADASPPPELRDPVKEAGQKAIALQLRLKEMENAENLRNETAAPQPQQPRPEVEEQQQQQAPTAEQIIDGSGLPELAKHWLRQHSDYVTDPAKNARLRKLHNVAEWQSGEEYTPAYFNRMDVLLGFRQEAQPSNGNAAPQRAPQAAPARRPAYVGSFSAPPTREAPSMRTGQAPSRQPQLTREELDVAQNCGISPEEYQKQKMEWERQKRAPGFDDGRNR
jgi:hypothetical protein